VAQGETHAQHYLRVLFEGGGGVAKDRSKAIRFYRLAAGQSPGIFLLSLVGLSGVILLAFLCDRIAHWPLPLPLTLDCAAEAAGKELKL